MKNDSRRFMEPLGKENQDNRQKQRSKTRRGHDYEDDSRRHFQDEDDDSRRWRKYRKFEWEEGDD